MFVHPGAPQGRGVATVMQVCYTTCNNNNNNNKLLVIILLTVISQCNNNARLCQEIQSSFQNKLYIYIYIEREREREIPSGAKTRIPFCAF